MKMGEKEQVKYFNKKFNCIFNKSPPDMKPLDSISIDYYTNLLAQQYFRVHKESDHH